MPIYYEARLAKIDPNFEEGTEDTEKSTKEKPFWNRPNCFVPSGRPNHFVKM